MLPPFCRAFSLVKGGLEAGEYEDAFWQPDSTESAEVFRYAVADGATETSFSGEWARQLVIGYGGGRIGSDDSIQYLDELRRSWWQTVNQQQLPWYAQEKAARGAFSTLLGLTIHEPSRDGTARWTAVSIGDSCLFQVRRGQLKTFLPFSVSTEFNSRPFLLSTNLSDRSVIDQMITVQGTWEVDDVFYLMTDALAYWFIRSVELGSPPWLLLDNLLDNPAIAFESFIVGLRDSGALKNDDVTLLRVVI